jgi:tryptophan synthase beta subunit
VKKATEEAATKKKAAEEATKKKAVEEAVKKAADGAAVVKKATVYVATASSGPCPFPSIGVKRAAAPSASTPPAKRRFLSF